jgi:large subunit ribosomal protein L13
VKTYVAKPAAVERNWYVVDAEGQVLGRLASKIASMLRGKHKPIFTPHVDTGDHIIVVNAEKIVLTGKKLDQKMYTYHTGYPGGLKEIPYRQLMVKKPEFALKEAVRGMLPKGPLGSAMLKKLRVYRGPEHAHQAQKPVEFALTK